MTIEIYSFKQFSTNLNALYIICYRIHDIETLVILEIGICINSIFNYNMQLITYKILFLNLFIQFLVGQK